VLIKMTQKRQNVRVHISFIDNMLSTCHTELLLLANWLLISLLKRLRFPLLLPERLSLSQISLVSHRHSLCLS
jgi:hypothetical protein